MSQLFALVWLKWRLVRNSLRSRRAAAGRAAAALTMAIGLVLAVGVGAVLGVAAYVTASAEQGGRGDGSARLFLLFIFVMVFMLWALVPLGMSGGSRFDAGRLLLYPVSLKKLFAVDLVSELASLSTVFAAPTVFGIAVGAGAAAGSLSKAVLAGLAAFLCGLALAKLLSTAVGSLMRRRRTRGETVLALLGGVLGLAGALMGQLAPYLARQAESLRGVRWTPPGAAAVALSEGLGARGGQAYALAVLTLAAYAAAFVVITYRIARRTALGVGGGSRRGRKTRASASAGAYAGWQLPFVSAEMSALLEKELRYAARNAQLKVIAVMAIGLTVVIRLAPFGSGAGRGGGGAGWERFTPYAAGAGTVFSMLYVFMLVSPLSTNLFGYDGAGWRALVLAPIARWKILVGKNVAVTLVTAVLALATVVAGGLVFGDLTAGTLLFALLSFLSYAALFALAGNWFSLHFPKRVEFGKRMNRSGVAGLMLVPVFVALAAVPVGSVAAAHFARSHAVKYVILALVAAASFGLYLLLITRQGRTLARRELDIMEAVTGRSDEEGGQILG